MTELNFVELDGAVMTALLDRDLARAGARAGVPLTDFFLTDSALWLWRYRLGQMAGDPARASWCGRLAVCGPGGAVVGHGGFHGPPDDRGMVEVGYAVDPAFRRRGYARATLTELLRRAAAAPGVSTVRASIRPDNVASLATIAGFGFTEAGELWDEGDGMEALYEVPATRFLSAS
ncbi:GNAT family N-acetyltransferase [Streptomyces sp. ISL-100]|uniref:GNAT family N-acetyltransferase n=1 Tax=Streptomyces sp. ISL-100 TaxID=2819173 RepID=UPI0027E599D4|nr:GNAT family N-acetyltransferase [Streptomyces sp. ISL-100]